MMNARASILTVAAFAALVCATPAFAGIDFPAPKDAKVVVVGEGMVLNGMTMSTWELTSPRDPASVLEFYQRKWATLPDGSPGFTVVPLGEWTVLTHVDEDEGLVYTVQVQSGEVGGTLALLGVSDMLDAKPVPAAQLGSDIPKMAGSAVQNDLVAQDLGVRSRTIMLENMHSVQQNVDFYIRHFERDGWAIEQGAILDGTGSGAIIAAVGSKRWNMTFVPRKGSTYVVAVLEER